MLSHASKQIADLLCETTPRTSRLNKISILFVPVVDLMDVSEDDLVFSPHVIRNTLFFHPAHVALMGRGRII